MISIGYEATSLAVSPYGGIGQYCFHVLRCAATNPEFEPTALYRHGSEVHLEPTGAAAVRLTWLSRFTGRRFDIVHGLGHRLPVVRGRKIVYTVHDAWSLRPNRWQGSEYQKKLEKRMRREIARADLVVADSNWTREQLLALGVVASDRCRTVPLGVVMPDEQQTPEVSAEVAAIIERPYVLFVGRVENRKNLEHVVEAVRPLEHLTLVLVGEPGFGYERIAADVLARFPTERLVRLQRVSPDDLNALYRQATATLQPSWEEGFGLPVLEGMAYGSPVITTDGTSCAEVAGDGALLVNPSRPEESRRWLERLGEETGFRDTVIVRAKARAMLFSWERSFALLLDEYRRLLGS